jgi:hypothetical protein
VFNAFTIFLAHSMAFQQNEVIDYFRHSRTPFQSHSASIPHRLAQRRLAFFDTFAISFPSPVLTHSSPNHHRIIQHCLVTFAIFILPLAKSCLNHHRITIESFSNVQSLDILYGHSLNHPLCVRTSSSSTPSHLSIICHLVYLSSVSLSLINT